MNLLAGGTVTRDAVGRVAARRAERRADVADERRGYEFCFVEKRQERDLNRNQTCSLTTFAARD